jgi:hypothetical protein
MNRHERRAMKKHGRRKSEEPVDLTQEEQRTRAMLAGLEEQIKEMALEAVSKASTHVLFAGDPRAELMISEMDEDFVAKLHSQVGSEPFVGLLPLDAAEGLIRRFAEINPDAGEMLRRFHTPISADSFRIVTICGNALGVQALRVEQKAPEPELINGLPIVFMPDDAKPPPDDPDGYMLSARGIVKFLLSLDLDDCKSEQRRAQAQRLQERARAVWATEALRPNPRSFDQVIEAEFKVSKLRAAIRASGGGKGNLFDMALEALMASDRVS